MLPKNLSSSYQQYKNDTDTIASWLATTAKQFGYVSKTQSKSSKKRGKGKAADNAPAQPRKGRTTYIIAIKDFTTLAEFIAAKVEPVINVPPRFAALLDRAIETRQWYSRAISPHIPAGMSKTQSDDQHAFFLGILKSVRDTLKPRFPKKYTTKGKTPNSMNDLLNMYENLELEDPSEQFQQAPDVVMPPVNPEAADANYKAERVDSIKEDFLALSFLLAELYKLRTEVNKTWEAYQQGLIDLAPAAITTNTAVDLARSLEGDLKAQFAKYGGTEDMLPMFYYAQCEQAGTKESFKERPGDELNFKVYDMADVIFWPAFYTLSLFADHIEAGYLTEFKPGIIEVYDPSSDRSRKTDRERYKEDKAILFEFLPEVMVLAKATERTPAEDEFVRGLRIFFKMKKVPLWLAFATTLFLDTHIEHILRDQVDYAFKKLADTFDFVRINIRINLKFHEKLRIDSWPKQNDEAMAAFVDKIQHWMQDDPHRKTAQQLGRRNPPKPHYFYRQHPWSCGLWKYYIQLHFRSMCIDFVNAWGFVMDCGHLYNAVRQEKLLTKMWSDMELCFAIQDHKTFFVGGTPTNPEDYLTRFSLAMGESATSANHYKGGRKNKGPFVSKKGPHSLKYLAPVATTFQERYSGHKSTRFELRAEDVGKILEKSEFQYEGDGDDRTVTKKLSVVSLLTTLRDTLQAEWFEISYDYLTLHRFCWSILQSVKGHCRDHLIKAYGLNYIGDEDDDDDQFFMVWCIFFTEANTSRLNGFMKAKQTDKVTSAVMAEAANALREMLDTGLGDVVRKTLCEKLGFPVESRDDDNE